MSAYAVAGSDPEIAVATSSVISVQDLVHRYGDRSALNGVSFDVRPAELFGLLGPNGSGKLAWRIAPMRRQKPFLAACSGGSNWRRDYSITLRSCFSTNLLPDSILELAAICGSTCKSCVTKKKSP